MSEQKDAAVLPRMAYAPDKPGYGVQGAVDAPPHIWDTIKKLKRSYGLTPYEVNVELTEWEHFSRRRPEHCFRLNPYDIANPKDAQRYRKNGHAPTVLRTCVLHCAAGARCPQYYTRKDVLTKGFMEPVPLMARCLYNELCPPHRLDCNCIDNKLALPAEVTLDKECYCRVALVDVVSIKCKWDPQKPEGVHAYFELGFADHAWPAGVTIVWFLPFVAQSPGAMSVETLMDKTMPISLQLSMPSGGPIGGGELRLMDTAFRPDREARLRECLVTEVFGVLDANPKTARKYYQRLKKFKRRIKKETDKAQQQHDAENPTEYQTRRSQMVLKLIRAYELLKVVHRPIAYVEKAIAQYASAYLKTSHVREGAPASEVLSGPKKLIDVNRVDVLDALLLQEINLDRLSDQKFLEFATGIAERYAKTHLKEEIAD